MIAISDPVVNVHQNFVVSLLFLEKELAVLVLDVLVFAECLVVELECVLEVLELRLLCSCLRICTRRPLVLLLPNALDRGHF